MGRETLGTTPEGAFRVPVIKESSVNERPSISEITKAPSAIEGFAALGELIHRTARPPLERVFAAVNRQWSRQIVEVGQTDPSKLNMTHIEDVDSGVRACLEATAELESHERILDQRVEGRKAIISELERVEEGL